MTAAAVPPSASLRLVDVDEEHELQGHALALESHNLRRRAERYTAALEHGEVIPRGEVSAVQRAFRAYRPFVFARDRRLNDAASRALSAATAGLRAHRPESSVA